MQKVTTMLVAINFNFQSLTTPLKVKSVYHSFSRESRWDDSAALASYSSSDVPCLYSFTILLSSSYFLSFYFFFSLNCHCLHLAATTVRTSDTSAYVSYFCCCTHESTRSCRELPPVFLTVIFTFLFRKTKL